MVNGVCLAPWTVRRHVAEPVDTCWLGKPAFSPERRKLDFLIGVAWQLLRGCSCLILRNLGVSRRQSWLPSTPISGTSRKTMVNCCVAKRNGSARERCVGHRTASMLTSPEGTRTIRRMCGWDERRSSLTSRLRSGAGRTQWT